MRKFFVYSPVLNVECDVLRLTFQSAARYIAMNIPRSVTSPIMHAGSDNRRGSSLKRAWKHAMGKFSQRSTFKAATFFPGTSSSYRRFCTSIASYFSSSHSPRLPHASMDRLHKQAKTRIILVMPRFSEKRAWDETG
jgi:hypothetical protein